MSVQSAAFLNKRPDPQNVTSWPTARNVLLKKGRGVSIKFRDMLRHIGILELLFCSFYDAASMPLLGWLVNDEMERIWMDVKEIRWKGVNWMRLAQDVVQW